jgi:hypothetical protein
VLEVVFILLEFPSPSRRVFFGSHSLPPLWFAVSVLHLVCPKSLTIQPLVCLDHCPQQRHMTRQPPHQLSQLIILIPQTSPIYPQERTPAHTESSRPLQQRHTTSHPQIVHELGQQGPYGAARMDAQSSIGQRWVKRGYHLSMPTRRTNQLFLKPQQWQSSDQIEFTQARQKIKAQVTQLPMPLPQLT